MRNLALWACILGLGLMVLATNAHTAQVKVIEGIIEDVKSDKILVRGHYYDISGATLKDASNEKATISKDSLQRGKKVEIFLHNEKVVTVLVYDENIVE